MPTLGKFIQRRRLELGYTQEQLAEKIGHTCRQAEVSRLENDGVKLPRRERLEQIAVALEVSIGELLARSGWAGADDEFDQEVSVIDGTRMQRPTLKTEDATPSGTLSDAIERAEELIAISDQVLESSQTAYVQARRAVRYSSTGRTEKGRHPTG